jgi:Rhomboid family
MVSSDEAVYGDNSGESGCAGCVAIRAAIVVAAESILYDVGRDSKHIQHRGINVQSPVSVDALCGEHGDAVCDWAAMYVCTVGDRADGIVCDQVGVQNFTSIYIGTGVAGALTALSWHVLRRNFVYVSLGASGAMHGILGVFCAIEPR